MTRLLHILIADDSASDAALAARQIERAGYEVRWETADTAAAVKAALEREAWDVVLCDYTMPDFNGIDALGIVRASGRDVPFIFVSGTIGEDVAVEAMKAGAQDYVMKGNLKRLVPAIERELREAAGRREKRLVEEALRASEVQYRRLFETAKDGILILDTETGMVVDVNPFLVELLGYSREAFLGKKVWELGFFKDIAANQTNFTELQQQGYVRYEDLPLETADGRRIEVGFVSNVYLVNHQKVIQCNIRDITQRRKAEKKMWRLQTELEQSNRDLQHRNQEIQTFYHTLSHELKTPLTSAREFVSILLDGLAGPLNETQLEYLGIAKESCDQLRLYINDMLDVTRLETGKMSLKFQALSLASLVEGTVRMLTPAAAGKSISLRCGCRPDLPDVPLDQQRILQVLTNLTTNAIKFTPAGGQICLELSEAPADSECLQVVVRDTGRGIPADQLGLIFNRLYQAYCNDGLAESRSGLGLGLYICQELVQLHGGRIWAESEPGQGSNFIFTIPKRQVPASQNVLVVDDDPVAIELVRAQLEPEHYTATLASTGTEALQQMHCHLPDVVVLDLQMPGLDGADTLKEIRKAWGAIPVILLTSYPESELMMRALEEAPFMVLVKPCAARRLVEAVRTAVVSQKPRRGKGNAASPLTG